MRMHIFAALAALVVCTSAFAARTTITLDQPAPSFGDQVTFTVTTDRTDEPFVQVDCFQSGALVYRQTLRATEAFTLGPTELWQGGSADCTATALRYDGRKGLLRPIGSMEFAVSA